MADAIENSASIGSGSMVLMDVACACYALILLLMLMLCNAANVDRMKRRRIVL